MFIKHEEWIDWTWSHKTCFLLFSLNLYTLWIPQQIGLKRFRPLELIDFLISKSINWTRHCVFREGGGSFFLSFFLHLCFEWLGSTWGFLALHFRLTLIRLFEKMFWLPVWYFFLSSPVVSFSVGTWCAGFQVVCPNVPCREIDVLQLLDFLSWLLFNFV